MRHLPAAAMQPVLWLLLTFVLIFPRAAAAADAPGIVKPPVSISLPGCPSMCGDVEIPYPFGIGDGCSFRHNFSITCDHSFNPPRPITGRNIEMTNITLETGEMRVFTPVSYVCYNSRNTTNDSRLQSNWSLTSYRISPTSNEFTAIGCYTVAVLRAGHDDGSYFSTGCITSCASVEKAANDGDNCAGLGCCKTNISPNLTTISVEWWNNGNNAWEYSPCWYAFVAQKGWYNFSRRDLIRNNFASRVGNRTVPLILDWAIRKNGSCGDDGRAPACVSNNSFCHVKATNGDGYLCKCSEGYTGNPYLPDGCTNINECDELTKYPCYNGSTCHDTEGSYMCKCKLGYKGDGKSEKGCQPILTSTEIVILILFGIAVPLVAVLIFTFMRHKQRARRRLFSKRNGDEILKRMNITTFTEEDLDKMTNKYSSTIGKGNFGKVFKGTTKESQLVAVKCAILEAENQQAGGEFVDEITFQFKFCHENLVRLIGCCLETATPRLVFEFISNGSLHDMLHGGDNNRQRVLSLPDRLDIAIGSAEALAYMHSHGNGKHIHGDIKPANILLDGNLKPKVSDFGSSKLLPSTKEYTEYVAADGNYIDPVYNKTGRLTVKSDVYSFGVVLLELITRKTARYGGHNSLTIDFDKSCKVHGNGREMYDQEILSDGNAQSHHYMESLDMIGTLVVRCLSGDADERPTMADVVDELKKVKEIACEKTSLF